MQKHWRQMRIYQFAPALFSAALLFSLLLSPFSVFSRLIFVLIVGSYAVANVIASVATLQMKDWLKVPLLSLSFAILHLSYGVGFLYGLVYFHNRWRSDERSPQFPQATETPGRA